MGSGIQLCTLIGPPSSFLFLAASGNIAKVHYKAYLIWYEFLEYIVGCMGSYSHGTLGLRCLIVDMIFSALSDDLL